MQVNPKIRQKSTIKPGSVAKRISWRISALIGFAYGSALFAASLPDYNTLSKSLARIPLSFERNASQEADKSAGWIGHANGYRVALRATGATISPVAPGRSDAVGMRLVNARPEAASQPLEPLPGKTNYLIGRDPKRWIRDVETYGRVEYREAYRRIDVAWHGNQGQIEYDFLLKPDADPSRIRVRFEGTRKLALEAGGDVRIEAAAGTMKLRAPEVYQEIAGARRRVAGRYVLRAANEIAFDLAEYDKSKPLVIDPTLAYGTYFGEGLSVTAIATDTQGNIYIGGGTATGLPLVNPLQPGSLGNSDVWITKFNPTGTSLIYSTYVGGSAYDGIVTQSSIAVTSTGELIAGGQTYSTDFPLVNPVQSQGPANGYCLPFAFELNAAGNGLVYSTYLGGNPPDGATGWAVATDAAGDAYIAGEADGRFATTAGVYQRTYGGGWSDAFVVKLGPTGAMIYSTMVGGAGMDYATAIKADSKGNVYIAGNTSSTAFPKNPPGAVTTNAGGLDVFVAKLNPTGSKVEWLTFLGGTGDDIPTAMVRDASSGELYVAGHTDSSDLPTTAGVVQPAATGPEQGFVASINPGGMSFGFVTYLGGGKEDWIHGLALTTSGLVVGGSTSSTSFPVSNAIQPAFTGFSTSLYASSNSGASWTAADTGLPASVIGLAPDPSSPGAMLAVSGSDFGSFQTYFASFRTVNGGASWTRTGLAPLFMWFLATGAQVVWAPSQPTVVYTAYPFSGGTDDFASLTHVSNFLAFGSNDDGATWRYLATPPAASSDSLAGIAVSPTDANEIVEVSLEGDVFQSTDGGASFTPISTLGSTVSWGYPSVVASSPDGSIYVGACNLFKSSDFGSTWTNQSLPECIGNVAVSPSNPSVVYAGSAWNNTLDLYRSSDAGATWTQVTSPGVNGQPGSMLVVAPSNANVVYAASGNQIVVSNNGGTTWSTASSLPANIWTLGVSASNPAVVYAGADSTYDGFAAKLSTDGTTLVWSTFYSGGSGASVNAVAAAGSSSAWIAGSSSPGLPITHNAYSSNAYGGSAFLARVSDSTAACSYALSPASVLAYGAETVNVTITAPSGCAWTATPTGTWVTIQSGSSGSGSGVISAALAANQTSATRTGSISAGGKSFAIRQAAASCTYAFSGNTNVPSSGGTIQIAVTAPAHCPWSAISQSSIVSIVSGASGSGNGTVTLSLPANDSVVWLSPTVQIGPQTVTLQEADVCSYSLSPQSLGDAAGSGTMSVTANLAGCSWSPTSDSSWLTVSGSGTGSATFPYSVTQNTTGAPRTANVTLDHQTFPVTQAP